MFEERKRGKEENRKEEEKEEGIKKKVSLLYASELRGWSSFFSLLLFLLLVEWCEPHDPTRQPFPSLLFSSLHFFLFVAHLTISFHWYSCGFSSLLRLLSLLSSIRQVNCSADKRTKEKTHALCLSVCLCAHSHPTPISSSWFLSK